MGGRSIQNFGDTAQRLARNPIGIIALFIVLVYGIAGLVFGLSGSQFDTSQKWALILFLVLFPPLVFAGFLWLVARHSHKLYAPSDFRKDESFVQLNEKVAVIEVRQRAAQIDPRGDSDLAFSVLEELVKADQIEAAKSLAKAFLKVKRYEISLKMFDLLIGNLDSDKCTPVLQYRAYSLIGLGQYSEALRELDRLRLTDDDRCYDFWPRLAVAYCYLKLSKSSEFKRALQGAVAFPGASGYYEMVSDLYPELAVSFGREPKVLRDEREGQERGSAL